MKVYVWRHNKTYHSHSMINEPCVQNHFYLDALAIADKLGYPVVLRPAYTMGGEGGGLVYNVDELKTLLEVALIQSTGASNRIEGISTGYVRV